MDFFCYLWFLRKGKKVEKVEDEGKLAEMRLQQQIFAKAELRHHY